MHNFKPLCKILKYNYTLFHQKIMHTCTHITNSHMFAHTYIPHKCTNSTLHALLHTYSHTNVNHTLSLSLSTHCTSATVAVP